MPQKKHSEISGIVKMLTSCLTNWQSLHAALRWVFVRADLEDKEAFWEVTCMYGFKVGDRENSSFDSKGCSWPSGQQGRALFIRNATEASAPRLL